MAADAAFDVAIIDIKGLGAEGIELAREIRDHKQAAGGTEIILLVGVNDLAGGDYIEKLGAFAILTKPARPSALFDCFASIASDAGGKGIAPLVTRRNNRAAVEAGRRARSARRPSEQDALRSTPGSVSLIPSPAD
jgi:DNA-binding NarL/FixJ family response regulator